MLQNTYEDWDNYVISLEWDKAVISSVSKEENQWKIGKISVRSLLGAALRMRWRLWQIC